MGRHPFCRPRRRQDACDECWKQGRCVHAARPGCMWLQLRMSGPGCQAWICYPRPCTDVSPMRVSRTLGPYISGLIPDRGSTHVRTVVGPPSGGFFVSARTSRDARCWIGARECLATSCGAGQRTASPQRPSRRRSDGVTNSVECQRWPNGDSMQEELRGAESRYAGLPELESLLSYLHQASIACAVGAFPLAPVS